MNTLNIISTTIALTACCSFFTPLMASTPDGETPAEELVCEEAGLSGPLKGLCNAYCEAMDCDSDDPHASAKACSKVLGNYAKHAEPDSVIPCEVPVECPCIDTWENFANNSWPLSIQQPGWGNPVLFTDNSPTSAHCELGINLSNRDAFLPGAQTGVFSVFTETNINGKDIICQDTITFNAEDDPDGTKASRSTEVIIGSTGLSDSDAQEVVNSCAQYLEPRCQPSSP